MPEHATFMACEKMDSCAWNETAYNHQIDPSWSWRDEQLRRYIAEKAEQDARKSVGPVATENAKPEQPADTSGDTTSNLGKREVDDEAKAAAKLLLDTAKEFDASPSITPSTTIPGEEPAKTEPDAQPETVKGPEVDLLRPLSHLEHIENLFKQNNLPKGYVAVNDHKYILR